MSDAESRISVITPVYCPDQHLLDLTERLFLESIARSGVKDDLEVIIVDDASPKGEELKAMVDRVAKERDLDARVVRSDINQGFGRSVNLGVESSSYPYLLITNNDIYASESSIPRLLSFLKSDRNYGAVGPMMSFAGGHKYQELDCNIMLKGFTEVEYRWIESVARNVSKNYEGRVAFSNWLVGGFMMMPRQVFDNVGRVDPNYHLGYHEESDLLVRVRRQGYKVAVDQSTFVFHGDLGIRDFFGSSMSTVKARAAYNLVRNFVYFTFKNGMKEAFSLVYDFNSKIKP